MTNFWDRKNNTQQEQPPMELDEEAFAELQTNQEQDIFEEEEEDMSSVLFDANLRLEQGRLYQMIMNSDIFADTNADIKAIKNVTREMRKFARERMETMLGMRVEQPTERTIVSSPFNDMEVNVLKLLASKMSKGATESEQTPPQPIAPPKKDGITAISGNTKPKTTTPLKSSNPIQRTAKPVNPQPKPQPKQPAPAEHGLTKPIDQMSQEELAIHNDLAAEQNSRRYAALPSNLTPMPTGDSLETLYTIQASRALQPGGAVESVMSLVNRQRNVF